MLSANAVGRRPGHDGTLTIAYSAHLDTVFPAGTDVTVRFEGEKMHAPGISDNSRGLVALLGVLRSLQHAGIETAANVLFIGNVGEEGLGDLRGVKHLFSEGAEKIDTLIVIDGGESGRIVYGGVGSHRYRITFRGPVVIRGARSGSPTRIMPWAAQSEFSTRTRPASQTVGEKTTYNVGRIGGGTSINSIPSEAWMEVDMRSGRQAKTRRHRRDTGLSCPTGAAGGERSASRWPGN